MGNENASEHRYGEQLDAVAAQLMRVHPIAAVKSIGRMECATATEEIVERILGVNELGRVTERILGACHNEMRRQDALLSQSLAAMKAAIRIESLWCPRQVWPESEHEDVALMMMRDHLTAAIAAAESE